jgi:hypothetical protein
MANQTLPDCKEQLPNSDSCGHERQANVIKKTSVNTAIHPACWCAAAPVLREHVAAFQLRVGLSNPLVPVLPRADDAHDARPYFSCAEIQ